MTRGVAAPSAVRAKAMLVLGYLFIFARDFPRAERWLAESETLYTELHDALGVTHTTYARGLLAERQSDLEPAERLLTAAMTDFSRRGMPAWEANCRFCLSNVAIKRHDYDRARAELEAALQLHERTGWGSGKAVVLGNLSWVATLQGDLDRAEAIGHEALALGWASHDHFRVVEELGGLAWIAAQRGDGVRAARLGGAASALGETIGYDMRTSDHPELDVVVQRLLGEAFAAAWHAGRSLPPEDAVAEALAAAATRSGPPSDRSAS